MAYIKCPHCDYSDLGEKIIWNDIKADYEVAIECPNCSKTVIIELKARKIFF